MGTPLQDNEPVLQNNNTNITQDHNIYNIQGEEQNSLFIRIDEKTIQCNFCHKILHTHYSRHGKICKRVPVNTCMFCKKKFNHQSAHSRHQKTCKAKPVATVLVTIVPEIVNINNNIINNIVINNNNNYNDNRTYIQNNTFGHEDLTVILNKLEQDPRLKEAVSNFKTALSLVHFNKDFPENQTIRKMNKRSNTIELRQSVDPERWDLEPFETGFGRVMDNLQRQLKVDLNHMYPINYLRDHMYHLSKVQPAVTTSEIVPPPPPAVTEASASASALANQKQRLHQIAIEERDRFIKESKPNWQFDRSNVERCRVFNDQLHDMFRQKGLFYKVVNTHEPSQFWHLFQFLSKRQDELEYVKTRL
jgi:hypothetical protein